MLTSNARHFKFSIAVCTLLWVSFSNGLKPAAAAELLTIIPAQSEIAALAGATVTIQGSLINRTNTDLVSTDLGLDFARYDAAVLTPFQEIGATQFTLRTYSQLSGVALFSTALAVDAPEGNYTLQLVLQDIYGNMSDPVDLTFNILAVPEPGPAVLLVSGLMMMAARAKRERVVCSSTAAA